MSQEKLHCGWIVINMGMLTTCSAIQVGADPQIAGLVVAISSINTFMLPTHQVNALIMQPGGYKSADYMRVGSGVMVLFIVILITMPALFY
ncbi:MAG: hypothetical protein HY895_04825 [Deltaproteobacteria bacterium]|nr:hypothetical protein [Deltaproteobacteria bacterium]